MKLGSWFHLLAVTFKSFFKPPNLFKVIKEKHLCMYTYHVHMEGWGRYQVALETGSFTQPPTSWWPVNLSKSLVSSSHSTRDRGVLSHLAFTLVLGIWTLTLLLTRQVLFPTEPTPQPRNMVLDLKVPCNCPSVIANHGFPCKMEPN